MSGHIIGGWEYVWGVWGVAWFGIAAYSLSLWLRRRKE
jgi:hypothetical protein